MRNFTPLLCTLIIVFTACEAHVRIEPTSGKTFCECAEVNFSWAATDQNDEPLNNVTIVTPAGEISEAGSGTYNERICESHTYMVKASNGTAKAESFPLVYEKIEGTREYALVYTCSGFIPVATGDEPNPGLMTSLRVLRICNGYTHKSITVSDAGWSFDIPAGGCVDTDALCETVSLFRWQSWSITSGAIIDPSITRETCGEIGDTRPAPGVINPGDLRLTIVVACSCE